METEIDNRFKQRLANLERAYAEFDSANSLKTYSKLERSGLIQTFEFTFELAWKTLQDLLISRGYQGLNGPRPVIEQCFQDGIIDDGENWLKMLISRNLTTHSYNEKTAEEIAQNIKTIYYPLISKLMVRLQNERDR
ncbi:MAG TPA: nucleotidyltransferase substrate binding protein [Myxococcota bacterium]|nr:nucleotidyltransferase substrate binding protein [Myxococcota bacterium]